MLASGPLPIVLHRGRVYLTVAALMLVGAVVFMHLSDDAVLFALAPVAELEEHLGLHRTLSMRVAIVAPTAALMLVAAGMLVWRRGWAFILGVTLASLLLQGGVSYVTVQEFQESRWLQKNLPTSFPNSKQLLDWQWLQFGVLALTNAVGYYAGVLALLVLARRDVRESFRPRPQPGPAGAPDEGAGQGGGPAGQRL